MSLSTLPIVPHVTVTHNLIRKCLPPPSSQIHPHCPLGYLMHRHPYVPHQKPKTLRKQRDARMEAPRTPPARMEVIRSRSCCTVTWPVLEGAAPPGASLIDPPQPKPARLDTETKQEGHTNVSTNAWVYYAASTRCRGGEMGLGGEKSHW